MLGLVVGSVVLTGVGYIAGTVLHELSHAASVYATGSTLNGVRWRRMLVEYNPRNRRADRWVKATPAILTPLLAGLVLFSVTTISGYIFAVGLLGGYIPRDLTEYVSVGQLLVNGD